MILVKVRLLPFSGVGAAESFIGGLRYAVLCVGKGEVRAKSAVRDAEVDAVGMRIAGAVDSAEVIPCRQ